VGSVGDAIAEVEAGERFAFRENWARFLELVDETRIESAKESLCGFLGVEDLVGRSFIDVGSGSGLFSLAARSLGADVFSFDFDPASIACTTELRRRYCPDDPQWRIERGSALDAEYVNSLGTFDVVYSWGVLHHTGDMAAGLENAANLVAPGERLFLAIYNDQGRASRNSARVKKAYVQAGPAGRHVILNGADAYFRLRSLSGLRRAYRTVRRLQKPVTVERPRGMDRRRDMVDWVGGWSHDTALRADPRTWT
jgi:2-polyprenyl-3-methyl-5-hydroxy-6-metoxy-1,4-benzoquinol methylase